MIYCSSITIRYFQIDTLIITQETVYLFEVKNYEGDFYYKSDRLYTISGKEIKEPLQQMKRIESLLRQLLQNLGFNFPIEAYLIFINPEFTLYQSPLNQPIIFPTQLNRFMKKLNRIPSLLNNQHKKLADHLISAHIIDSPFTRIPHYDYEQLQKGIICAKCYSFLLSCGDRKIACDKCGHVEKVESAIMRSVVEHRLLFPDRKISSNGTFEWCKVIESKKMIGRILKQNLKAKGYGQWSYYE